MGPPKPRGLKPRGLGEARGPPRGESGRGARSAVLHKAGAPADATVGARAREEGMSSAAPGDAFQGGRHTEEEALSGPEECVGGGGRAGPNLGEARGRAPKEGRAPIGAWGARPHCTNRVEAPAARVRSVRWGARATGERARGQAAAAAGGHSKARAAAGGPRAREAARGSPTVGSQARRFGGAAGRGEGGEGPQAGRRESCKAADWTQSGGTAAGCAVRARRRRLCCEPRGLRWARGGALRGRAVTTARGTRPASAAGTAAAPA
jgi:hypothetical protein